MPATIVNTSINVLSGDVTKTAEIVKPIGYTVSQWILLHNPFGLFPPDITLSIVIGGVCRDVMQRRDWNTATGAMKKWSYELTADTEKIALTFTWPTGGCEADGEIAVMAKFI